ncbi:hypothetical protein Pyn_29398 [Prunus yedoensis var. nudiflora]|uniref:Uncharacterized protein n=1 Tax=Prunus yedoensis var. nudiflora TaxID=2094558 RepID=A0A314YFY1_PRUYE|nr:hypothetical protein Pyn_29398 [Prunus yedoensis var. nudiflora]
MDERVSGSTNGTTCINHSHNTALSQNALSQSDTIVGAFSFQQLDEWAWAAVKSKWLESPLVSEFENQTPSVLRKGSGALGNTLVIFTNKKTIACR